MIDPYAHYGEKNFYYLTKLLPYFMARTNRQDLRQQYLNQIENRLLLEYINEIDTEIRFLEDKDMQIKNIFKVSIVLLSKTYMKRCQL